MDALYPAAKQIPFLGAAGGSYVNGAPFRGVLHTTEAKDFTPSQMSYYGHSGISPLRMTQMEMLRSFSITAFAFLLVPSYILLVCSIPTVWVPFRSKSPGLPTKSRRYRRI
jgi:hypothetical protein